MLVICSDEKVIVKVPCIYYIIQFQKSLVKVKILLNSNNKVNTINFNYA